MTDEDSARRWVERAQQGDRDAFARLVETYGADLERLVRHRLRGPARADLDRDDVTSETLARALAAIHRFRWEGDGSFRRWLLRIADHVVAHAFERGRRRTTVEIPADLSASSTPPPTTLRRKERLERLEEALSVLPPDYREVLRLARIEGLKHREIALRMNRSHEAVRRLFVRALRRLREEFGDTESLHLPHYDDEPPADE